MAKDEALVMEGVVLENIPQTKFKVLILPPDTESENFNVESIPEENRTIITAHLSGRMRKNMIRIYPGDVVKIELSPYDVTQGRIVYRNK